MAKATWAQSNFLGGEWSPMMSGRYDHPKYGTALKRCLNALPTEEGAFQRRSGFKHVSRTRGGVYGRVLEFSSVASVPYMVELTDSHLRMYNGTLGAGLVYNADIVSVTAISNATPAVITIASDQGWATNDQINFIFDGTGNQQYPTVCAILKRRTFTVTRLTGTTYSIKDAVTSANIVGADVNFNSGHVPVWAASIMDIATPWSATEIPDVRLVQNQDRAIMLQGDNIPYVLEYARATNAGSFSTYCGTCNNLGMATLTQADMLDGPYLDIDQTGAYLLPNIVTPGVDNIVAMTIAFPLWEQHRSYATGAFVEYDDGGGLLAYVSLVNDNLNHAPAAGGTAYWGTADAGDINGAPGFTSDDVGRPVRLLSTPPLWAVGTAYAIGDPVTYNGLYYTATDASTGDEPDTNLDKWAPTTSITTATWTWGRITTTGTGTNPRFTLEILGPALLYTGNTNPIYTFRFGAYNSPNDNGGRYGYPTCGTFHQGRLWMAGAIPNRVDSSRPNGRYFEFTPTGPDGTVADDNGITETFNAGSSNVARWMLSMAEGVLCGTDGGEWLIAASALNDPLTPTSIQAHRKTKYGCAAMDPIETGMSIVFVQKFGRKIMEYVADVFSGKFSAPNLSEASKHLTQGGVKEIAYQDEQVPVVWARRGSSGNNHTKLSGLTYRRNSSFVTQQESFAAWHEHILGENGAYSHWSLCTTPSDDGTSSVLNTVTFDGNSPDAVTSTSYMVLQLQKTPEDTETIYTSFYLDNAIVPPPMLLSSDETTITIYGLWHLEGQTVDIWLDGVDASRTAVVSGGSTSVTLGGAYLTLANMQALSATANSTQPDIFGSYETTFAKSGGTVYKASCVVGLAFPSTGQALRPATPAAAGTPLGPPMGKTRRGHKFAMEVLSGIAGTVSMGTDANHLKPVNFTEGDDTTVKALSDTFTGVFVGELDDDYSYDGGLYWTITRPYPFTLLALSTFLASEER